MNCVQQNTRYTFIVEKKESVCNHSLLKLSFRFNSRLIQGVTFWGLFSNQLNVPYILRQHFFLPITIA